MLRVLLPLLAVGLAVYALVDLASSDEEERGGIPKGLWVVLIVLLPFLGPIAWIIVKRAQRGSGGRYGSTGRPSPGPGRRRRDVPVAPDDDPEFLWRLEQQQRRQSRDTPGGPQGAPPEPRDAAADDATEDGTTGDDVTRPGAGNGSDEDDDSPAR